MTTVSLYLRERPFERFKKIHFLKHHNAHVIGFPQGGKGGPRVNVGTLQTSSAIAPLTGALFFINPPHCPPVPGAL